MEHVAPAGLGLRLDHLPLDPEFARERERRGIAIEETVRALLDHESALAHGRGVSPGAGAGLEHLDLGAPEEAMGEGEAAHATADDRDAEPAGSGHVPTPCG